MRHLPALVLASLLLTPGAAAADWLSLRSDHFLVIGNASGGQLRDVALRLEQFREVVRLQGTRVIGPRSSSQASRRGNSQQLITRAAGMPARRACAIAVSA